MDPLFDGDEANLILPYTEEGIREVLDLMFITKHMVSMGSSTMIVGYHQDVNLGAYLLSLEGTYVEEQLWEDMAKLVWTHGREGKIISNSYEEWREDHIRRCMNVGVDPLSGRSLFSTLIPPGMNWTCQDAKAVDGILIKGVLSEKICSGSPSSLGMCIHQVYGPEYAMSWLNSSYQFLGRYVRRSGLTLGLSDIQISREKQKEIDSLIQNSIDKTPLPINVEDVVLNNRRESDIINHLSNIRDTVGVSILGDKDPKNTKFNTLVLKVDQDTLSKRRIPMRTPFTIGDREEITLTEGTVSISRQEGSIKYVLNGTTYIWSMSVFPEVIIDGVSYNHVVHPLRAMIDSGARGNSVSATQIAGSIGSLTYAGGRVPLMMQSGCKPQDIDLPSQGRRSMPIYPFGTNTPVARGFIPSSYLSGIKPGSYVLSHVASRENMSANTSLTPMTGYFGRSMRVFTENIQVDYVQGKQAVINERGVLVSLDHILDTSKTFAINGKYTFVNASYELEQVKKTIRSSTAVYVQLPYRKNYLEYDSWLHTLGKVDVDIIISIDPRSDQDYYIYLRDYLPKEISRKVTVLRSRNYMSFSEYKTITVLVPLQPIKDLLLTQTLPEGVSARLDIAMRKIPTPKDLFSLITGITDISSISMIVRPDRRYRGLLQQHSLVESLLILGDILPLQ
jgi:hypothetical protein